MIGVVCCIGLLKDAGECVELSIRVAIIVTPNFMCLPPCALLVRKPMPGVVVVSIRDNRRFTGSIVCSLGVTRHRIRHLSSFKL